MAGAKLTTCPDPEDCFRRPSCLPVTDEHHVQIVRRHALQCTAQLGMSRLSSHYVATAVSELANNLFFHTSNGGEIRFCCLDKAGRVGIEIIAQDEGPGIVDIAAAMTDGFSTNGGLGAGLGGVRRLMDEFEISSKPGIGTRIIARKWLTEAELCCDRKSH